MGALVSYSIKCISTYTTSNVLCLVPRSRASSKRLERISKGHRLWHIVDRQDCPDDGWDEDWMQGQDAGERGDIHFENSETRSVAAAKGGLKGLGVDLDVSWLPGYDKVDMSAV